MPELTEQTLDEQVQFVKHEMLLCLSAAHNIENEAHHHSLLMSAHRHGVVLQALAAVQQCEQMYRLEKKLGNIDAALQKLGIVQSPEQAARIVDTLGTLINVLENPLTVDVR